MRQAARHRVSLNSHSKQRRFSTRVALLLSSNKSSLQLYMRVIKPSNLLNGNSSIAVIEVNLKYTTHGPTKWAIRVSYIYANIDYCAIGREYKWATRENGFQVVNSSTDECCQLERSSPTAKQTVEIFTEFDQY